MSSTQVQFPGSSRLAVLLAASALLYAAELTPTHQPLFSDYPFNEWAAAPDHSSIKWEVHLLRAQLSVHQRLIQRIETVIPGGELAKRRGRGELVLLTRFEDSEGHQWRSGNRMSLREMEASVKSNQLTFITAAFIKPGDYRVSIALADSETGEHNFIHRSLHVGPLKSDPLPNSWDGLPAVEMIQMSDGPESWLLPSVHGVLKLPLRNSENLYSEPAPVPVSANATQVHTERASYVLPSGERKTEAPKIELLVNTSPSERFGASNGTMRRNMSVVIPALKVLSSIDANVRPPQAAVMDLTRHRITFETPDAATLDWNALGKVLSATNPSVIDAKILARQSSMREYFAGEIARRAGQSGPPRWLIVLSGSFSFSNQHESTLPHLAPDPNRHIVYFRFLPEFGPSDGPLTAGPSAHIAPPRRVHGPTPGLGTIIPFGPARGRGGRGSSEALFPDDFESILKSMGAQVITVSNPETFRKSLASLLDQISAN
ncbi:MAG TPA: hypothetical protein VHA14_04440 [Bryobacteraceae bacterium]|nr:hypothetical protein [Bryobacteraceae bacterium]